MQRPVLAEALYGIGVFRAPGESVLLRNRWGVAGFLRRIVAVAATDLGWCHPRSRRRDRNLARAVVHGVVKP